MKQAKRKTIRVDRKKLEINPDVYEWCLKTFDMIESNFGINIFLHDDHDSLEEGQIFLFNHFARFETVIPPYIFYKKMGVFSRTIADYRLYHGEKLSSFLYGGGAVPNNLPGLLPYMAAEILKGRKIVIFPEGGMIKDRRVMDDQGQFRILSPTHNTYRKHHRGAAVLALTLELFKQRIRDLFDNSDYQRLDHWCEALDIESHEELKRRIDIHTKVVPGTITFNPIRIGDNILSRAVRFMTKGKAEMFIEEMTVEGNILLKDTDMDIRLGKPIIARQEWHFWERWLLDRYFLSIKSLDEFFSLKDSKEKWTERLLSKIVEKETDRIRDIYMEEIYKGITINLGHIASDLVLSYVDIGREEVQKSEFHRAIYLTVKELQYNKDVHLHKSLKEPDNFTHLLDGDGEEFKQFMRTANRAKLIEQTKQTYILNDKLTHKHAYAQVRRENPILVCANEAEPVSEIHNAVIRSMEKAKQEHSKSISKALFDDEIREFIWRKGKYSHPKYASLNIEETATEPADPYLLIHENKNINKGVLLIHGFTSSPAELREFGEQLYNAGYNVMGVRLAGHGTSPYDLENFTWQDWYASVEHGYEILSGFVDEIVMVGFSTGGTLGLQFAATHPEKVSAFACVCAPLSIQGSAVPFVPVINGLNNILSLTNSSGIKRFVPSHTSNPTINYKNIPLKAVNELIQLMKQVQKVLPNVSTPTLVLQSTQDSVIKAASAEVIYKNISSSKKKLHWIESEKHSLITHNIGDAVKTVREFIDKAHKNNNGEQS